MTSAPTTADLTGGCVRAGPRGRAARVLHVVPPDFGYVFGGHARYLLALLNRWPGLGVEFLCTGSDHPLAFRSATPGVGSLTPEAAASSLWRGSVPSSRIARYRGDVRLLLTLWRRRHEFDLVHVHAMNWSALLAPTVCRMLGRSTVYTVTRQGMDDPSTIGRARFGSAKISLFRRYDAFVALSPAIEADCRRWRAGRRVLLLPNFLLLPGLEGGRDATRRARGRERLGIGASDLVLLFVGSAISRKGIDTAVDSFLRLRRRGVHPWLLIVGPCTAAESSKISEPFVTGLRRRLEEAGEANRVVWAGLIREEETLEEMYHVSDILFFPSLAEGLSNVVLEALYAGLPVVASKLEGSTTLQVSEGVNGHLVAPGDAAGFTERLAHLAGDPLLLATMGNTAHADARARFGFDAYCVKLSRLYRELARRPDTLGHAGAAP